MHYKRELSVIMPVYNEGKVIESTVTEWLKTLRELNIDFSMYIIDDGSTDDTRDKIDALIKNNTEIIIVTKSNSGHGPTIITGYLANNDAKWLFQLDSDNEIPPGHFKQLWLNRKQFDFLIGHRENRDSSTSRYLLSLFSKLTVRICFGGGIKDVNSPYRLFRTKLFIKFIANMPKNTFAPNVLLSGVACFKKYRIFETAVNFQKRQSGTSSLNSWRLVSVAIVSFLQTIKYRFKLSSQI